MKNKIRNTIIGIPSIMFLISAAGIEDINGNFCMASAVGTVISLAALILLGIISIYATEKSA